MKLEPLELQKIEGFISIYKTLPPDKKEAAKGKASALSTWQGTDPHTRSVNAYLLKEMLTADAVAKSQQQTETAGSVAPPTTAEVMRALKPVAVAIGGAIAIGGAGYWTIVGIAAVGRAIEAFFVAYGSLIVGAAFCLVALLFLVSGMRGEASAETVEMPNEKRPVNIIINVDGEQNVKVG